jgi:hypothetical protein
VKCSLISAWKSWCLSSKGGFEIFLGKVLSFRRAGCRIGYEHEIPDFPDDDLRYVDGR